MLSDLRQGFSPVRCAVRDVHQLRRGLCSVASRRGSSWCLRGRVGFLGLSRMRVNRLRGEVSGSLRRRCGLPPLPLSHVCSDGSYLRKRVLSGCVQAEMADLSSQARVASSGGYNQAVVYGSCGLFRCNPFTSVVLRSALARVLLQSCGFCLDCLLF
ncbi:hypothetical protein Bca4012_015800 [Brassica carinata]